MLTIHGTFLIPWHIIIPQLIYGKTSVSPGFFVEIVSVKFDALTFNFYKKTPKIYYVFMIKKDWNFCDQILKAVAILGRKFKISIYIFSSSIPLSSKILSNLMFHSAVVLQQVY